MLKRLYKIPLETGDTLVEVIIVLAVLALAVSISYATANRSLLNTRQAQENSQATEYTQTQIEALRVLVSNSTPTNTDPTTNIFLPISPYCINSVTASPPISYSCSFATSPGFSYLVQVYDCAKIHIGPCSGITDTNTLVVQTTWPDVLGQGSDSVTLTYKAYPSST